MLRPELLRFPRPDGGLDLYDPLLERVLTLSAAEAAELSAPSPVLLTRLDAAALLEGPAAVLLRAQMYQARAGLRAEPVAAAQLAPTDWDALAGRLPEALPVEPHWRQGESWRRAAETLTAGNRAARFDALFAPAAVHTLRAEHTALAYTRMNTRVVQGARAVPEDGGGLGDWLRHDAVRALLGAVLNQALPPTVHVNAWLLGVGDSMGVHPDGPRYLATFSLGLEPAWTAAGGGAITFGEPVGERFAVSERWLPHAGDALLFAPTPTSWHAVETVRAAERRTLTAWYLSN